MNIKLLTLMLLTGISSSTFAVINEDITLNINLSKAVRAQGYMLKDEAKIEYAASNPSGLCMKRRVGFDEDGKIDVLRIPTTRHETMKILTTTEDSFQVIVPTSYTKKSKCEYMFVSVEIEFCHELLGNCYKHRIDSSEEFVLLDNAKEKYFTNYNTCKNDGESEYSHETKINYLTFDYDSTEHFCSDPFITDFNASDYYNACPGKTTNISFGVNEAPSYSGTFSADLKHAAFKKGDKDRVIEEKIIVEIGTELTIKSNTISFSTPLLFKNTMGSIGHGNGKYKTAYNYSFSYFSNDGKFFEGTIYLQDSDIFGQPTEIFLETYQMLNREVNSCNNHDGDNAFPTKELGRYRIVNLNKISK